MNPMFLRIAVLLIIILLPFQLLAQEAESQNLRLEIKENRVHIHYDIVNSSPARDHKVDLLFLDQEYNYFDPQKLSGDIGSNVSGGANKTIVWDAMADRFDFSRKMTPQILLDWKKKGGPENALLSLLMPGLGDYFVADTRDMTIKPYMRTLSGLGFVALGIIANEKRKQVPLYSYSDVEYIDTETGDYLQRRENVIYGHRTRYWLFDTDAEIFLGIGAAIWAADILWVAVKGFQNEEINRYLGNTQFQINSRGMFLGYSFEF